MSHKFISSALAVVIAAACCASQSFSEEVDAATVVDGRRAGLRDLGAAFKNATDELRKSSPVLAEVRQSVAQIDDLAKQQKFWFPPGSGPQPDVDTKAKAEIWTKAAQFAEARAALEREAAKLLQVAAGNDVDAIRSQHKAVGKACEGCHRQFREKEED